MPTATFPFDTSDFGLGPDYDPTRDPVYGPQANQAQPAATPLPSPSQRGDAGGEDSSASVRAELPPADRAWHLFCQGMRYSAIARELHLDRHTVARYIKQIHDETQVDRRADRALALTQALGALAETQATAWDEITHQQARDRVVWDMYFRAVADAADRAHALAAGHAVRPPTNHTQIARLLTLILATVRETARLELLYEPQAPARDGDDPDDEQKDHFFYTMMRRSDQEELERMRQQRSAPTANGAPSDGAPDRASNSLPDSAPNHEDDPAVPSVSSASSVVPLESQPPAAAAPPYQPHDADGNPPIPHPHPRPDLRPDGTDDWFVYKRSPLSPPPNLPQLPGAPSFRRRRWDRR